MDEIPSKLWGSPLDHLWPTSTREEKTSRMEVTEEYMTLKEMREKIAERDYSLNQQKDLTAKMRQWLDVADDDMATLRSENASLKKQAKALEKVIREAQKVEAEPCNGLLDDDLGVKTCSKKMIQELEKETTTMKKQNKKLTEEFKSLQRERDQDQIDFSKFRVTLQTFECGMKEAQLELQNRDEVIYQKGLQLKHLEETVEDYSDTIEYLRLANQELREQLEGRQDEASLTIVNDLSFAEEIKLLTSSAEVKTIVSDSTDLRHEETEAEELLEPQCLSLDLQTKRHAGILEAAVQTAGHFLVFVAVLSVLVFVASRSCRGSFCSINTLWSVGSQILKPYCTLRYGALPPL